MQTILSGASPMMEAAQSPADDRANRRRARRRSSSWGSLLFGVAIALALVIGWLTKGRFVEAESGTGYYLGIAGAVSMLLLLTYPLRKNIRFLHGVGSVSFWFRTHMALGLIGPTLILYHANFGLGSMNSNVALTAMLIVAASGIVGRVFYAKIHRGLYGKRAEARELMSEAQELRDRLSLDIGDSLAEEIDALERAAFENAPGMGSAAVKAFSVVAKSRRLRRKFMKQLKSAGARLGRGEGASLHLSLSKRYFNRIEQAAELGFYERMFAAWHLLHLPLFALLIVTAIIHVIAVHLY